MEATQQMTSRPAACVAVVITTYNHTAFLEDAIASVEAQLHPVTEIVVVDDGSTDNPGQVTAKHPAVRLLSQSNQGLSAARNLGLKAVTAEYVIFLDADDRLLPTAVTAGLACLQRMPDAALAYGAHRRIDRSGAPSSGAIYNPIGADPYLALLGLNIIGMHATVLYRRDMLVACGGFDTSLRRCEDYDVYLRLARDHSIASYPEIVAEYRWHGGNMSLDRRAMLRAALVVHDRQRAQAARLKLSRREWRRLRRSWIDWYAAEEVVAASSRPRLRRFVAVARLSPRWAISTESERLWAGLRRRLPWQVARSLPGPHLTPPVGRVAFGDFGTPTPISRDFGFDRGLPIDRHFVEQFLDEHASDVKGSVLEVGNDDYSRRFGGSNVLQQAVVDIDAANPKATIIGDLTLPGTLPESAFDCIVLTQTLHLLYDLAAAVDNLWLALKPGGVLLVTAPGISQIDRSHAKDCWYWSLTGLSMRRLFAAKFGPDRVAVRTYGNVYAATTYLQGLACSEVDRASLDVQDDAYPVIVACRAVRGEK